MNIWDRVHCKLLWQSGENLLSPSVLQELWKTALCDLTTHFIHFVLKKKGFRILKDHLRSLLKVQKQKLECCIKPGASMQSSANKPCLPTASLQSVPASMFVMLFIQSGVSQSGEPPPILPCQGLSLPKILLVSPITILRYHLWNAPNPVPVLCYPVPTS